MRYIVLITQLKKKNLSRSVHNTLKITLLISYQYWQYLDFTPHLQISGFTLLKGRNSCQVMFFFIMMAVKCMYMWQIDMQSFICKESCFLSRIFKLQSSHTSSIFFFISFWNKLFLSQNPNRPLPKEFGPVDVGVSL